MNKQSNHFWLDKLIDRMDDDFSIFEKQSGTPHDYGAFASSYVIHGAYLGTRVMDIESEVMCKFLRTLADHIEHDIDGMPFIGTEVVDA